MQERHHQSIDPAGPAPQLVLASGSQRRQQFLQLLGLPYTLLAANIDETPLANEEPAAMTLRLAVEKARAAAARLPADETPHLIIAADTTVALGGAIYGKPENAADAVRMLRDLRARSHQVYSAIAIFRPADGTLAVRVNTTLVEMRDYTDLEIEAYVASGDPLDKAGAYGIQARNFAPVCALQGCYSGVMGLPLADLTDLLAEFGVAAPAPAEQVCSLFNSHVCCVRRS